MRIPFACHLIFLLAFVEDELASSSVVDVVEGDGMCTDGAFEFTFEISIVFSSFDTAAAVPVLSWSFMVEVAAVTVLTCCVICFNVLEHWFIFLRLFIIFIKSY